MTAAARSPRCICHWQRSVRSLAMTSRETAIGAGDSARPNDDRTFSDRADTPRALVSLRSTALVVGPYNIHRSRVGAGFYPARRWPSSGRHKTTNKKDGQRPSFFVYQSLSSLRTAMKASVGTWTVPRLRIFFLPVGKASLFNGASRANLNDAAQRRLADARKRARISRCPA